MDINALVIFHKVAETNSFSIASRVLEIPISTISRKINKLEEDLKHKLFIRTTRKINLTSEGQLLYTSSKPLFDEFNTLGNLFEKDQDIAGDVRITSTIEHKYFLAPKIVEFRKMYPNINLFINFSNDVKDMIENSYDFAFRAGKLKDSSVYAHKLYTENIHAYIHKDYFPGDLSVECLTEFDYCMMEHFSSFKTIDGQVFKPKKKVVTNSIEFILEYAKHQPSIVYLPESHTPSDFLKLNIFETLTSTFQIVYLHKKLNRPCSLFLDFFKQMTFENMKINII
jgi:DNA-binding transcriptional LysR family regulator